MASWLFLLMSSTGVAEELWGPPLPLAPFDREPFRSVKVPDWLEGITSYAFGAEAGDAAAGVEMAPIGVGGCEDVFYASRLLPRNVAVPEKLLGEQIESLHQAGIRVIAAIPPRIQAAMYAQHADWRSVGRRGQKPPEVTKENPLGGALCLLGPWGDYLIEVLAETLLLFPHVVGFSFDGIHTSGVCYCEHCLGAYRKETGLEIPDVNMNDLAFRRYQHWLDRRIEGVVRRMQIRLKGINPDCALVTWTTNAGRFGHFLDIPRNMPARLNLLFDSPGQEFWLDETNRGNTVVPAFANAYIWAVTNHRHAHSEPYIMSHGNPYGTDSFPPEEMLRRVLLTITHGPRAALSFGWPGLREAATSAFGEGARRRSWLHHVRPEPWAALLMSDDTRTFYGREPGKVEERYLANVLGTYRATLEEHLPTTVINDWNLTGEGLRPYQVLTLPNAACLTPEAAAAVRQYVEEGGGLVASIDTSAFDDFGEPRADFLLADVFGLHHRGVPAPPSGKPEALDENFAKGIDASYWEKRKSVFDLRILDHDLFGSLRLRGLVGDRPVTFKGPAVAVGVMEGARVIATMAPKGADQPALPAIVSHTFGKGRVIYFAAGVDAGYYAYPYPYERLLVAGALRWVARAAPTIAVEAPMCVQSTFFRQSLGGERLVVHLYSDLNTTGGHAKPDDDVPLREEVVPIHGIRVRFTGYSISRAHLEPGGLELKTEEVEGGVMVTVPRLDIHSMVVAELR